MTDGTLALFVEDPGELTRHLDRFSPTRQPFTSRAPGSSV